MKTQLSYLKWFFNIILFLNIKPEKGIKVIKNFSGYLTKSRIPISLLKFGTLIFISKEGDINDKTGAFISNNHSIFGESYVEYDINSKRYWRYSYCKYNKTLRYFIEIHLGYNDEKPVFRFRIRKQELIY